MCCAFASRQYFYLWHPSRESSLCKQCRNGNNLRKLVGWVLFSQKEWGGDDLRGKCVRVGRHSPLWPWGSKASPTQRAHILGELSRETRGLRRSVSVGPHHRSPWTPVGGWMNPLVRALVLACALSSGRLRFLFAAGDWAPPPLRPLLGPNKDLLVSWLKAYNAMTLYYSFNIRVNEIKLMWTPVESVVMETIWQSRFLLSFVDSCESTNHTVHYYNNHNLHVFFQMDNCRPTSVRACACVFPGDVGTLPFLTPEGKLPFCVLTDCLYIKCA